MADVYQQLWKAAASTNDEGKAVRTLARILLDKEGRSFILRLERNDAELCVELLDRVSPDLYLPSSFAASDGFFRASQSITSGPRRSRLSSPP